MCPFEALLSMVLQSVETVLMKAQTLKDQLLHIENIASDEVGMVCQQKLQKIYHDALIRDLEYSLDQKAEVDLWNHGFRNSIVTLQTQARDKKNPKRDESESRLTHFLESATAFYAGLLHDICSAFDLELPFRRNGRNFACPKKILPPKVIAKPNKNSCYYMCQYCLVHLGDLARYRHLGRQAELFYRYAVQLSPCSGHPYNQLALVEAARGDRLSTVFYYVRSMSVRHPFPAAALNLMKTLNQYVDEQIDIEGRVKLSVSECVTVFLRFHGLLAKATDLDVAEKYVKLLTNTLTALVATDSFSGAQLVQMLAINLYALHQKRESAFLSKTTVLSEPDLEDNELQAKRLVLHLVAGSLSAFLLPVYTLKDGISLLDYFALPAIKLTLDWIHLESSVLLEAAFLSRRQIWPSLCKLLNVIQPYLQDFSAERWSQVPLPEDRNLQCFIPLEGLLNNYSYLSADPESSFLRFLFDEPKMETVTTNKLRAARLVEFGKWLSEQEQYNLLKMRKETGKTETMVFELAYSLPTDIVSKEISPVPDDSVSSKSNSITKAPKNSKSAAAGGGIKPETTPEKLVTSKISIEVKGNGKGNTDTTSNQATVNTLAPPNQTTGIMKKYRHNVAMQAILKKMDQETAKTTETKQVTFRTPSPSMQDVDKRNQHKQSKNLQEKQNLSQFTNKTIFTDKNRPVAAATDSTGKSVSFSLPRVREINNVTEKQTQPGHKVQERIYTPSKQIQEKNLEPGKTAPLVGVNKSLQSSGNQDKTYLLSTQNSLKKNVTFSDDKILSFAAQVLQGKSVTNKTMLPPQKHQEKSGSFPTTGTKDKTVPLSSSATDIKNSLYTSTNSKEKPISFSGVLKDPPLIQPYSESSSVYAPHSTNSKSTIQSSVRDTKTTLPTATKANTDFLPLNVFGGVGSFPQTLFKTPLFNLPDTQETHSASDSVQMYPTSSSDVPVTQYSTGHSNIYQGKETIQNSEFTNISDINNIVPSVIGSEHNVFPSSGLSSTYSHACSQSFQDCIGKARPPPGYSTVQAPKPPVTWWKQEDSPSSPIAPWWKLDTGPENSTKSGDENSSLQYNSLNYSRQPSLHMGNESTTKNDTGYMSHLWNINSPSMSVDVNLHHKLVGNNSQRQSTYPTTESSAGVFSTDLYGLRDGAESVAPEASTHNAGSYVESRSAYSVPPQQSQPTGDSTYSLFSSSQWSAPSSVQSSQQDTNLGGLLSSNGVGGFGSQVAGGNIGNYAPGVSVFPIPPQGSPSLEENNTYSLFSSTQWMPPTPTQGSRLLNASETNAFGAQVPPYRPTNYASMTSGFPITQGQSTSAVENTYSLFSSIPRITPTSQEEMAFGGLQLPTDRNKFGADCSWAETGSSPLKRLLEQQKLLRELPSLKKGT